MLSPRIDDRSEKDILAAIERLARAYVPGWRFDLEHPDAGSALAQLFAEMFAQSVERLNGVPERNFIMFLNMLGARLQPALPAEGYARFSLTDGVSEAAFVGAGERLTADPGDESERVPFETVQDLLVTPARLQDIYCVSPHTDRIVRLYEADEDGAGERFRLFDFGGENLQRRLLAFAHDEAFFITNGALTLRVAPPAASPAQAAAIAALSDPQACRWSVAAPEGALWPVQEVAPAPGGVTLSIACPGGVPRAALQGLHSRFLVAEALDVRRLRALQVSDPAIDLYAEHIPPDFAYTNDVEQDRSGFLAFGAPFSLYTDLVITCNEALCKRGAAITMRFRLRYERVSIERSDAGQNIDWKLIMRRADVRPEELFDITIAQVAWEYWNGRGWARLTSDPAFEEVFAAEGGEEERMVRLRFTCPQDIAPVLWGAQEGFVVRARIRRMNNALRTRGWYVAPFLSEIAFGYAYEGGALSPQHVAYSGNLEEGAITCDRLRTQGRALAPFEPWPHTLPAAYFRFDRPPAGAPIRMLLDVRADVEGPMPALSWTYLRREGERAAFVPLNAQDETGDLCRAGLVTFMGRADMAERSLFGRTGYWLRLSGQSDEYQDRAAPLLPLVSGIYMNCAQVCQADRQPDQLFDVPAYKPGLTLSLARPGVLSCQVFVESRAVTSVQECAALIARGEAAPEYAPDGSLTALWIRWTAVPDLLLSGPDERHYQLDAIEGVIRFGDGACGRVPHDGATVRVCARIGGGEHGNLPAGALDSMERQLGYINRVENPLPTFGGCGQERVQEAAGRSVAQLRHLQRAVTERDYEDIAMEATRAIQRAVCFAGRDENGAPRPGDVCVVVLQRDFEQSGLFFQRVREQVMEYLCERAPGQLVKGGHLHVVSPLFLSVCCRIEALVGSFEDVYFVEQEIAARLTSFLHPVKGNYGGVGWAVGQIPNTTQLYNAVKNVPRLQRIRRVMMTAYATDSSGRHEVNLDRPDQLVYALPVSGEHDVHIIVETAPA